MIYTDKQLKAKLLYMVESFENEVIEFKEARANYSFNDIGKYFSALSNEANLRGLQEAWLIFGISDDRRYVGTAFRKQGNLQSLKKEIVNGTNERLTFLEIYELTMEKCRVIAFQIPPAIRGIPTTWQGAAYAREHESISPLPMNKVDLIRSQIGMDWSKEIVKEATIEDLDQDAIKKARELFSKRQNDRKKAQEILRKLSDIEVLNKAGITIKGNITRTALLLLGKNESKFYFDGFIPRITWTLYNADNSVKAYEHFDMPMLLAVDKAYSKIRNEKYRYITGQQTLFPDEVDQYEPELIKEIINNCIAHQDYRLRGKINVEEFEDRLVFINEGAFIPETIEQALEPGYKPPYYRNMFLCNAMVNLYMIDTNSMGIPMMYQIQRDKCFPLPTYDLNTINRVKVTVYGKILDKNYTQLLYSNENLDMRTVFLLDKVQKQEVVSKESFKQLKKNGLVEGRYPNVFVSFKVADMVGQKAEYVRNKGLDDDICKQLIVKALQSMGKASKKDLMAVLERALPEVLSEEQKSKKVSNLLQAMKRDEIIVTTGTNRYAKWHLNNLKQ
ncbi:Divergent AAA domain [uncultured Roseburia sp.]|uniref:DNA binding domain-containing protein n=1 Tax=Brotonthovivens ammoniilytica TaxID=2981725 RepID=A0ABT2TJS0_9FIRM|nr:RNA-binding domain-containing protein [Brotonthovivens ammoniilytica]MCU6761882.1 putative DNA binding domain-containing protein [Brotonthovivens ammoniilytica]SCI49478.1 Divergent AAA domain [uncultured Roseburia sp.]